MALIDIYDKNFEPKGLATYEQTQNCSDWRQVFHNWIARPKNKILIQKRSNDHPHNPGALCVSAAGQMQAGETIRHSTRETKEELGLAFTYNDVTYIGAVHLRAANEIAHVSFARDATHLKHYQLQKKEVAGIYEMAINDGRDFFNRETRIISLKGYKRTEDGLVEDVIEARHEDFSTDTRKPWLWMLDKAESYLNGEYNGKVADVNIENPLEVF